MISVTENGNVYDFRGLEAEKDNLVGKATNGSTFFAIDTGNVYMYDITKESSDPWTAI